MGPPQGTGPLVADGGIGESAGEKRGLVYGGATIRM
jgi:hypothetical protein